MKMRRESISAVSIKNRCLIDVCDEGVRDGPAESTDGERCAAGGRVVGVCVGSLHSRSRAAWQAVAPR